MRLTAPQLDKAPLAVTRLKETQLRHGGLRPSQRLLRTATSLTLGACTLLTLSCSDNDSTLYIQGVLAPQKPACEYSNDPGELMLGRGILDVAIRSDYQGIVLVANQLTPRGAKNQLRAETSSFQVRGAEVQLSNSQGNVLDEFSVRGAGFVGVSRSEAPGYGLAQVTLIPPSRGESLAGDLEGRPGATRTLVASVRVYGETLGGVELTSGDFTFPIDVCYGCLINYPLDALDPADDGSGAVCAVGSEGVSLDQCNPGQDEPIDCRACAASLDVCYNVP